MNEFANKVAVSLVTLVLTAVVTVVAIEPVKALWNRSRGQFPIKDIYDAPATCSHISGIPKTAFDNMSPTSIASYRVYRRLTNEPAYALCTIIGNACTPAGLPSAARNYCVTFDSRSCSFVDSIDYATKQEVPGLEQPACR